MAQGLDNLLNLCFVWLLNSHLNHFKNSEQIFAMVAFYVVE